MKHTGVGNKKYIWYTILKRAITKSNRWYSLPEKPDTLAHIWQIAKPTVKIHITYNQVHYVMWGPVIDKVLTEGPANNIRGYVVIHNTATNQYFQAWIKFRGPYIAVSKIKEMNLTDDKPA
jgi:hypothetical protein